MSLRQRYATLALGFLGLSLLYFAKPLLLGESYVRGDIGAYFYPHRLFLARSIQGGEVPLWNPLTFCGVPYFSEPLNSFFYPPNWLFVVWPRPGTVWALLIVHLAFGGLGAALLAREVMRTEWLPAFCGGCVYAFSGYWCMHTGHFTQVLAGAWTPWVCWAAARWLREPRRASFCLCAALAGVQLLPGGTENVCYLLWALCVLGLIHAGASVARLRRATESGLDGGDLRGAVRPGLGLIGIMALGGGLSAVQLVPAVEQLIFSIRWGGMAYEYSGKHSLPLWQPLVQLVLPNYGGLLGPTPYIPNEVPHGEMVAYVGPVAVILASLGVARRWKEPAVRCCAALSLACLLLAFGRHTPFYKALYSLGLSMFRNPSRAVYLVTLGVAVLAAAGAQVVLGGGLRPLRSRVHAVVLAALSAVALGLMLLVVCPKATGLLTLHTRPWLYVGDVSITLLSLAVGYSALILASVEHRRRALLLAVLLPLFAYMRESEFFNQPRHDPAEAKARDSIVATAGNRLGPHRVYSRHWSYTQTDEMMGPGLPEATGIHGGLCPLRRYWELQQRQGPDSCLSHARGRRFVDLIGAKLHFHDGPSGDEEFELVRQLGPLRLYENRSARPRAALVPRGLVLSDEETLDTMANRQWDPSATVLLDRQSAFFGVADGSVAGDGTAEIRSDTNNTVVCEVGAPAPAFLVLSDTYYPGWEATVDGEPAELLRANYLFRAVAVAPGKHTVKFRYRPQSLVIGLSVSCVALLALILILRTGIGRRTRCSPDPR